MRIKFSQAVSGKNPASIGIVSGCNHAELAILGSGSFINSDGSEWYGEKVTLPRGIYQKVYLSRRVTSFSINGIISELDLSGLPIVNNVSEFFSLRGLAHLNLRNTSTYGNLSEAKRLRDSLIYLDLSFTKVDGDTNDLNPLRKLKFLDISGTTIKGYREELVGLKDIITLRLNANVVDHDLGLNDKIMSYIKRSLEV